MSKPTLATLKSFFRKNEGKLFIAVKSDFDGMVDCVMPCSGKFKPATKSERVHQISNDLGYNGVWLVGSSRDHIKPYYDDDLIGYEVYNCCGSWIVAVSKILPSQAA